MKTIFNTVLVSIALWAISCVAYSQEVDFKIVDGASSAEIGDRVSANISRFLNEANDAFAESRRPDLSAIAISDDAVDAFMMLWDNMPFHCGEAEIVERLLTTYDGLQVRNVPIEACTDSGEAYQELVIDMDRTGKITRINLAIKNNLYRQVMRNGSEVTDLRHRQMILDYVEQFRTAYNRKDIDFLEKVFSEDALIITGKVVKVKKGDHAAVLKDNRQIVYTQLKKREYIERLRTRVFPAAKYIRVDFSDIRVSKHPSIDGYYGVMLKQGYQSSIYSDEGYLFMIWDFRDEANPQIHVRTWQPYWMDEGKKERLDESKVFNINNFTIE